MALRSSWRQTLCQASGSEESPQQQQNKQVGSPQTGWFRVETCDALGCLGDRFPLFLLGASVRRMKIRYLGPWIFLLCLSLQSSSCASSQHRWCDVLDISNVDTYWTPISTPTYWICHFGHIKSHIKWYQFVGTHTNPYRIPYQLQSAKPQNADIGYTHPQMSPPCRVFCGSLRGWLTNCPRLG